MKYDISENLVVVAELTIKPDRIEKFLDYTVANLEISRGFPGNIVFDILINEAKPEQVFFYEVWESAEAQAIYMASRIEAGDFTKLLSLLEGKPNFTTLRRIAE